MKEQLENLGYTNVKAIETPEGVGYVGLKNGGSIIIPPNYEQTQGLSMLVCGQGGQGNTIYGNKFSRPDELTGETLSGPSLLANANNGEFPSNAVVIAPNDLYPGFSQSHYRADPSQDLGANILNDAYNLLQNNGANITDVGVQSFSNGGPGSMLALGGFLELNPDADINTKVVLCDTYNVEEIVNLYDKTNLNGVEQGKVNAMNALINNNTEIYSLNWTSPKVYNNHANNVAALSKLMSEKGFNYAFSNSSRLQHADYMLDFFNGGGLDFLSGSGKLNLDNRYYSEFLRYDENGNEILATIKNAAYKTFAINAITKYAYLRSFAKLIPTNSNVSSDTLYVCEQMNKLREQISQSKFLLSNRKQVFSNSSSIPGCIGMYIDAYYNIMGSLMDSLMKETEVVTSIACAIDDMSSSLKNEAENLSDGASSLIEKVTTNVTTGNTNNNTANNNNNNNSSATHRHNFPAVHHRRNTSSNNNENNPETENTNSLNKKIEEIVKKRSDGSTLHISKNKDKVVDLKYVYEFKSKEEANGKINEIKKLFKDVDYIDDIKVNDKNIEIVFKNDSYKDMNYDEIIDKYLDGGK